MKFFDVLRARSGERVDPNLELELELMKIYKDQNAKRSRFTKISAIAVVCLLVTGVVAEASSGVLTNLIKSVTLDTGSGPQPVTEYQAVENSDGSVTVTVPLPEGQQSGTVTVNASGN